MGRNWLVSGKGLEFPIGKLYLGNPEKNALTKIDEINRNVV